MWVRAEGNRAVSIIETVDGAGVFSIRDDGKVIYLRPAVAEDYDGMTNIGTAATMFRGITITKHLRDVFFFAAHHTAMLTKGVPA